MASSTSSKPLRPCRDGHDCLLQYEYSAEHNSTYSHPCRWSELCRDVNRNSEHARQFTHDPHQTVPCKYGSEQCNKVTDPEHRRNYRHEGLPDFLLPCKHKDQCRDRSTDHLKKYGHPPSIHQKLHTTKMETMSTNRTQSRFTQYPCKYGAQCRNQLDPAHTNRYSHPSTDLSTQLLTTTTARSHIHHTGDDMQQAYRIGGALAIEKLSRSDQLAIQNMRSDAIIVVPGAHDHIDRVLDNLNIKYITVEQHQLSTYRFRSDQTVYINCALGYPVDGVRRLRQEVEKGLHIITTDWALSSVLQEAFSDFVRHNGQSTADEVVGIQVVDPNHPLVNGFLPASKHAEPQWWLEFASYPIEIVNQQQVRVLIRSKTLGEKYRSDAVMVTFDCGKGNVIHMISHFYLQRSETRDARHQMSAKQFAMDIKASAATTNLVADQGQNLNYAQIQSSSTSAQFIYNQISNRLNSKN